MVRGSSSDKEQFYSDFQLISFCKDLYHNPIEKKKKTRREDEFHCLKYKIPTE